MTKSTARQRIDRILLENSVERVINTSIRLIKKVPLTTAADHEDVSVNLEDWEELKPIVVALWNEARNRARAHAGHLVKIELEVDTLDQLAEALEHRARPRTRES